MLRELASGAPHIDDETFGMMNAVYLGARDVIVQGQDEGTFRQADPLLTYFTILPSILIFFARQRVLSQRKSAPDVAAAAPREIDDFIRHMQTSARAMLRKDTMTTTAMRLPIGHRRRTDLRWSLACREPEPSNSIRVSGHVEATEVQVAADVGGRLIELRVAEGDRVAAGDLIGRLDTRDVELQIVRARAERAAADAQLRLLQAGARPEEIRQAEAQVDAAEAEVAAATAELEGGRDRPRSGSRRCSRRTRARRRNETTPERGWTWLRERARSARGARAGCIAKSSLGCKPARPARSWTRRAHVCERSTPRSPCSRKLAPTR